MSTYTFISAAVPAEHLEETSQVFAQLTAEAQKLHMETQRVGDGSAPPTTTHFTLSIDGDVKQLVEARLANVTFPFSVEVRD